MQNVKQGSKFKMLSSSSLVLLAILSLFSCNKNVTEKPGLDDNEVNASMQSSQARENNGLVAVPFAETLFVPCANSGAGENITLTGTTNFVYHMRWNDHGFSLVYHANSRGLTGVGVSSGETFVGSDGTQGTVTGSWVNSQWKGITIEHMRIIGKNTTYIVKYKYQLIVTPDGNVTVSTIEKTIDCSM
jgi:hypothetical protein